MNREIMASRFRESAAAAEHTTFMHRGPLQPLIHLLSFEKTHETTGAAPAARVFLTRLSTSTPSRNITLCLTFQADVVGPRLPVSNDIPAPSKLARSFSGMGAD